jgi:MOB kinase activator 1
MSFLFGGANAKTFKPKKQIAEGTHQYDLMKRAAATLGAGNLRQAVALPDGEDINEWVAVHIVDFFNQINMLFGQFQRSHFVLAMDWGL